MHYCITCVIPLQTPSSTDNSTHPLLEQCITSNQPDNQQPDDQQLPVSTMSNDVEQLDNNPIQIENQQNAELVSCNVELTSLKAGNKTTSNNTMVLYQPPVVDKPE